ncbi:MAG: diacylglycerol kinase family protein, partial [Methylobacterium sp.]
MSAQTRRALLCCNAKARNGSLSLDEVRAILRAGGIEPVDPPGDGDACAAIRSMAGEVDLVILGGGDGTMNAAAEALVETGLPLAILPLGTANDLA